MSVSQLLLPDPLLDQGYGDGCDSDIDISNMSSQEEIHKGRRYSRSLGMDEAENNEEEDDEEDFFSPTPSSTGLSQLSTAGCSSPSLDPLSYTTPSRQIAMSVASDSHQGNREYKIGGGNDIQFDRTDIEEGGKEPDGHDASNTIGSHHSDSSYSIISAVLTRPGHSITGLGSPISSNTREQGENKARSDSDNDNRLTSQILREATAVTNMSSNYYHNNGTTEHSRNFQQWLATLSPESRSSAIVSNNDSSSLSHLQPAANEQSKLACREDLPLHRQEVSGLALASSSSRNDLSYRVALFSISYTALPCTHLLMS